MALPNKVLAGFQATLWCQTGSSPTPLTLTQLSTWTGEVQNIVGTVAGGSGSGGQQLNVEDIPAFGQDDASVNFAVAGSRQSDIIPTQSKPTSLTITAAWNPSDAGIALVQADAYNGTIDRTFVISAYDGVNVIAYAFTGRVSEFRIESTTKAEAKAIFSIHPRGNQYGWSHNT
jgi:hypothetical protein